MIRFKQLTKAQYNSISKNEDWLYFIIDTKQIYKGNVLFGSISNDLAYIVTNISDFTTINNAITNNGNITSVDIYSVGDLTTDNDLIITQNNVKFNIQVKKIIVNNNFAIKGKEVRYYNTEFNLTNDLSITSNTIFEDCLFNGDINIDTVDGCSISFINCIINGNINIQSTDVSSKFSKVTINNTKATNISINSLNSNEYITINYPYNATITIDSNNVSNVYDMQNPIFETVTTI